jgi:hypothetical protein
MIGERQHRHHKYIGLHKTHAKHIACKRVTPQNAAEPDSPARVSPHCPARLANVRPAHAPFASLMAVGWRALNFSRAK